MTTIITESPALEQGSSLPDPLRTTNANVKRIAIEHGLRSITLEDGERVIHLRGRTASRHKSDRPHAGQWSRDLWYALIPCSSPSRRTVILTRQFPDLIARSSDAEVLVLGSRALILRVLAEGPTWARGRVRRALSDEARAALAELGARNRFGKATPTAQKRGSSPQDRVVGPCTAREAGSVPDASRGAVSGGSEKVAR